MIKFFLKPFLAFIIYHNKLGRVVFFQAFFKVPMILPWTSTFSFVLQFVPLIDSRAISFCICRYIHFYPGPFLTVPHKKYCRSCLQKALFPANVVTHSLSQAQCTFSYFSFFFFTVLNSQVP